MTINRFLDNPAAHDPPARPTFRDVTDGDELPREVHDAMGQIDPVRLFEWFCPGIGRERAERVAEAGKREMAPVSVASLRSLVLRYWDAPPLPA